MNTILTILLFFNLIQPPTESFLDISDDVASAMKTGNASNVAKFFPANVDLKVLNKEDVYSKAQAELILKDFFAKNPIKSFAVIHKGTSKNGDQFAIGTYESTTGKKFRTYFLFKKEKTGLTIQQLRFEVQE
jgi:ribosome biogenesis GTPase A